MKILMIPMMVISINATCFGEASTASIIIKSVIKSVGSAGTKMIKSTQGNKDYQDISIKNDVKNDKVVTCNTTKNSIKFFRKNIKVKKIKVKNSVKNSKTANVNTTNGIDF